MLSAVHLLPVETSLLSVNSIPHRTLLPLALVSRSLYVGAPILRAILVFLSPLVLLALIPYLVAKGLLPMLAVKNTRPMLTVKGLLPMLAVENPLPMHTVKVPHQGRTGCNTGTTSTSTRATDS